MKTHLLFKANPEYQKARRIAHPIKYPKGTRLSGKIMPFTEEQMADWMAYNKDFPRTYCWQLSEEVEATHDISKVTCKSCLKAYNSQKKEAEKYGIVR